MGESSQSLCLPLAAWPPSWAPGLAPLWSPGSQPGPFLGAVRVFWVTGRQ